LAYPVDPVYRVRLAVKVSTCKTPPANIANVQVPLTGTCRPVLATTPTVECRITPTSDSRPQTSCSHIQGLESASDRRVGRCHPLLELELLQMALRTLTVVLVLALAAVAAAQPCIQCSVRNSFDSVVYVHFSTLAVSTNIAAAVQHVPRLPQTHLLSIHSDDKRLKLHSQCCLG
jgi:hypothetical protein